MMWFETTIALDQLFEDKSGEVTRRACLRYRRHQYPSWSPKSEKFDVTAAVTMQVPAQLHCATGSGFGIQLDRDIKSQPAAEGPLIR